MNRTRVIIAAFALVALVTQSVAFASDRFICQMTGREMVGCADEFAPAAEPAAVERSCCCEFRRGHPINAPVAVREGVVHGAEVTEAALPPQPLEAPDVWSDRPAAMRLDQERPPGCPRYLSLRQLLI